MKTFRTYQPALLAAISMLIAGCASLFPESCEQFDESRKTTNYATEYRLENRKMTGDIKPLGKGEVANVLGYTMQLDTERARPCSHLKINKEITLLRRDSPGIVFEETREFFAQDGTRIAVKNEVLTEQLKKSGRYASSVPLPIPKNAPPGKYRLTSTLTLKQKVKGVVKTVTLAKAATSFEVVEPKK